MLEVERRTLADIFGEAQIEMDECAMRAREVRGLTEAQCAAMRLCYICGTTLPAGRRRWCSRRCEMAWWTNHSWTHAAAAAARRDRWTCRRCRRSRGDVLDPGRCREDGQRWPCGVVDRVGPDAVTWPHFRLGGRHVVIEINHRVPLVGRGYHAGCVHHLSNLEALCHDCHVVTTTRQIRERKAQRRNRLLNGLTA